MQIVIRVLTWLLIDLTIAILMDYWIPKIRAKENRAEEIAQSNRVVKLSKNIRIAFIVLSIFVDVVGVVIAAFPKLITEFYQFDYTVTVVVWYVPLIFDNVMLYFMLTEVKYDDNVIVVKRPLTKTKTYKVDDIVSITHTGNLKVKTKQGSFTLFKALSGTESLRSFLITRVNNQQIDK